MFGFGRGRFPVILPALFLFGVLAFALAGPVGAAAGFVLFLPFFVLKMFFLFFLVGMMFRVVGGGGPWGRGRRGSWGPPRQPTEEERERAEARRQAKEEVDSLFPDL